MKRNNNFSIAMLSLLSNALVVRSLNTPFDKLRVTMRICKIVAMRIDRLVTIKIDKLGAIMRVLILSLFLGTNCLAQDSSGNLELTSDKIDPSHFYTTASVQILNKTTAKSSNIDLKINQETKFGTLSITARKCWKASIDQKPESKILLEVTEDQGSDGKSAIKRIFYGWIFASSPSVSGLEHPIYDIIALTCKK